MNSNYYLDFENKFRGSREKLLDLFYLYESLLEIAIYKDSSPSIVDIGCGRGEFLQKYKNMFSDSFGIESDQAMVEICRDNGLKVLNGDAIDKLSTLASNSISVITIFHMIEHLEHNKLTKLLAECFRVLSNDGVLIMETPSIDNIIVSTQTFHIDHTHINPINSDSICFYLEKIGFSHAKYFFLNPGPLKDATPLKITRILNGVAQDLCIIATKTETQFKNLFIDNTKWQSNLNIGLTTLEAATEFDLSWEPYTHNLCSKQEVASLKSEIDLLKNEIILLQSRLKYVMFSLEIFKYVLRPIFNFFRLIKKIILIIINKIFSILINNQYFRNIVVSPKVLKIFHFLLRLIGNSKSLHAIKIKNKLSKIIDHNEKFNNHNQKLLFHHKYSKKSKEYKNLFSSRK